ncbi:uncharacterized protein LOC110606385 [Manihot esculenta]|uniref:Uncharacterized protein n=2 Tax=Manihot esculenta TaxID=3983 RepID=A0A2C9WD94_MANES|nr:uncharacterized protein LOC110606385 [Manihot esculenta]KAG8660162.1 hypothetical protein MANES_02G122700v8 [Manihot esculenta]OAY57771.1 hypothetical protein MANES_02G122700v8 [Manihot esculenta]
MEWHRRPNRSDIHLSAEQEAKIQEETREHFDGLAPKRHTKPQRSEFSAQYVDAFPFPVSLPNHSSIPELLEFQRLQTDPQKLVYNGEGRVSEEFVATEYYEDLNCVDKQHHTTGTGFIKMENANGKCFCLAPDPVSLCHPSCRGNPATNEWIPAADDTVTFASDKPRRSDN